MLSTRLKQLRLARGLSLDALAASMGGLVTKQALSKYELGKARPSVVVLNKLATIMGVKSSFLWSNPAVNVKFIAYRKGSGLLKKEQARVEAPLSFIERRSFMKLSIEERRRIMAEQADKMVAYYWQDSDSKQLQGGDIIDYSTSTKPR